MTHYDQCPVCGGSRLIFIFTTKDHTVSMRDFDIFECMDCSFRFTQDIPGVEEIGVYYQSEDYISHTETKKGFVNRAYHMVRKFTLQQKKKLITQISGLRKGSILDIGAGTGAFLEVMKEAGWEVSGLEPDEKARAIAKSRGVAVLPSSELFSMEQLYDVITMWHVLEHVHDLHGYLDKMRSLLAANGTIIIAVPNYTSGDAKAYGPLWAAYDVPRHLYHFSPQSMEVLMKRHGMEVVDMKPMWFDSFYVSMLSEKYRTGNSNLILASWQGIKSNTAALKNVAQCSSIIYLIKKRLS